MVVVAISGMPGCGSTTAGKLLAGKLNVKFFSVGSRNKKEALGAIKGEKETQRAADFWKTKKGSSKKFHNESDEIQKELAKKGNIVIDGKLAIHMLKDDCDISVWLKASFDTRAKRVSERDGITLKEAKSILEEKEKLERKNFYRIYGFDYFGQEKEANIVIDVKDKTPEEIVKIIMTEIKKS